MLSSGRVPDLSQQPSPFSLQQTSPSLPGPSPSPSIFQASSSRLLGLPSHSTPLDVALFEQRLSITTRKLEQLQIASLPSSPGQGLATLIQNFDNFKVASSESSSHTEVEGSEEGEIRRVRKRVIKIPKSRRGANSNRPLEAMRPANGSGARPAPGAMDAPPPRLNLKKAAVKIVRKAAPATDSVAASSPPVTPSVASSENTAGPPKIVIEPPTMDRLKAKLPVDSTRAPKMSRTELEARFAQMNTASPPAKKAAKAADPQPRLATKESTMKDVTTKDVTTKDVTTKDVTTKDVTTKDVTTKEVTVPKADADAGTASAVSAVGSVEQIQKTYLTKALEYLLLLPNQPSVAVIQEAAKLISDIAGPADKGSALYTLKEKYVRAATDYLNGLGKAVFSTDRVLDLLSDSDGHFLFFAATVNAQGGIALVENNFEDITGLAKAICAVLPKEPVKPKPAAKPVEKPVAKPSVKEVVAAEAKPENTVRAEWPEPAQRPSGPTYRTVMLHGVSSITTINKLQALVWGGRVESFRFEPGQYTALVKFVTAEGCAKYYDATPNGIKLPEGPVILVERQPTPNSINDLLQIVIDKNVTRCVRVLDIDEDWKDEALMDLARGVKVRGVMIGGAKERLVDTIVRGKTPEGRSYVEFRFMDVYQAMNFKRSLDDDEDWEQCIITHGQDPCEKYNGVHFSD